MKRPFRERNPVPIGLIAFAVIIVLVLLALNLGNLPFVNGGKDYSAAFKEAAGLRKNEEVRIAGVKVGKVTGLDLDRRGFVKVSFQVDKGVRLGELTQAEIKIKTLLGAHFLAVEPRGPGRLNRMIPVENTHTPFEVVPAISELSQRFSQIDYKEVARSFDTLSETFKDSPDEIRASLRGLRRLSETVSSRDDQLHELTGRARSVSGLLAQRNQDFVALVRDGDKILQAIESRRTVIHQLLVNTVVLSQQVNALISENEAELRPMLANLQRVNRILLKNQSNLDRMIELYAPFARQFTDATGNGRWFDSYIQNLIPIPSHIENPPANGQRSGGSRTTRPGPKKSDNPLPFLP